MPDGSLGPTTAFSTGDIKPKVKTEVDLTPILTDSIMMIIPCPKATVVDVGRTVTHKTRRVCPQNIDVPIRKISSIDADRLETDVHSESGDRDAIDRHSLSSTLGCDRHDSLMILLKILQGSRPTVEITASALAGILSSTVGVAHPVSRKHGCSDWNTFASE